MSGKDEYNLLPKQRKFADLYLTGMYAAEALREAGYCATKPDKGAWKMLQRPEIREYLRHRRQELEKATAIHREDVVRWLQRVIFHPVGGAGEIPRDLLDSEIIRQGGTGSGSCNSRSLRTVSKMSALRLLCQLMGWTGPEQSREQQGSSELAEMIRRARAGEGKQSPS